MSVLLRSIILDRRDTLQRLKDDRDIASAAGKERSGDLWCQLLRSRKSGKGRLRGWGASHRGNRTAELFGFEKECVVKWAASNGVVTITRIKGLPFSVLQTLVSRIPSLTDRVCCGHTVCIGVSHPFGDGTA